MLSSTPYWVLWSSNSRANASIYVWWKSSTIPSAGSMILGTWMGAPTEIKDSWHSDVYIHLCCILIQNAAQMVVIKVDHLKLFLQCGIVSDVSEPRQQSSWGQHGALSTPDGPHEPCYMYQGPFRGCTVGIYDMVPGPTTLDKSVHPCSYPFSRKKRVFFSIWSANSQTPEKLVIFQAKVCKILKMGTHFASICLISSRIFI